MSLNLFSELTTFGKAFYKSPSEALSTAWRGVKEGTITDTPYLTPAMGLVGLASVFGGVVTADPAGIVLGMPPLVMAAADYHDAGLKLPPPKDDSAGKTPSLPTP